MRVIRHSLAGIAVAICVTACSTPSVTRTAIVKDVMIGDDLSPQSLLVHPGDEIRWVNVRKEPVQLDVPDLAHKELACQRGFRSWLGQIRESVDLQSNETVSLCFEHPSEVHYVVRAETTLSGGKHLLPGSVSVVETR